MQGWLKVVAAVVVLQIVGMVAYSQYASGDRYVVTEESGGASVVQSMGQSLRSARDTRSSTHHELVGKNVAPLKWPGATKAAPAPDAPGAAQVSKQPVVAAAEPEVPAAQPPAASDVVVPEKAAFGVAELVLGSEPDVFWPPDSYSTAKLDDQAVRDKYAELQKAGHPYLQHTPDHFKHESKWYPRMETMCKNVEHAMANARNHKYGVTYQQYWRYNIKRCPVETPECLAFLDPRMVNGAAKADQPADMCLSIYRKCCVEHRRLKNIYKWMVELFDSNNIRHMLSDGGLLGTFREGGALIAGDSDIDFRIPNPDRNKAKKLLQTAPRDKRLATKKVEDSPHHLFPRLVLGATTPPGDGHSSGDTHVEVYYDDRGGNSKMFKFSGPSMPILKCKFYDFVVGVPSNWQAILEEIFSKKKTKLFGGVGWEVQHRTPDITGMYNMHWCGHHKCCPPE